MGLCSEIMSLARHLMLFLVAIFAFSASNILEQANGRALELFALAFVVGIGSFLAGYRAIFQVVNDELANPSIEPAACKPSKIALRWIKTQYTLTVLSMIVLFAALIWPLLWS